MLGPAIAAILSRIVASRVSAVAAKEVATGDLGKGLFARATAARPPEPLNLPGRTERQIRPASIIESIKQVVRGPSAPPVQPGLTMAQKAAAIPTGAADFLANRGGPPNPPRRPTGIGFDPPDDEKKPAASGMGGLLGTAGKALGLTTPVGVGVAVTSMFAGLVVSGKKLAEAQVEGQRYLTRFNGAIALSFARLNVGDIMRSRRTGNATSESTAALVGAVNDMRDNLRPIKDGFTNVLNWIGTAGAKVVSYLASLVDEAAGVAGDVDDIKKQGQRPRKEQSPWEQSMLDKAKEYARSTAPRAARRRPL